jgi:hypothetical protein
LRVQKLGKCVANRPAELRHELCLQLSYLTQQTRNGNCSHGVDTKEVATLETSLPFGQKSYGFMMAKEEIVSCVS